MLEARTLQRFARARIVWLTMLSRLSFVLHYVLVGYSQDCIMTLECTRVKDFSTPIQKRSHVLPTAGSHDSLNPKECSLSAKGGVAGSPRSKGWRKDAQRLKTGEGVPL